MFESAMSSLYASTKSLFIHAMIVESKLFDIRSFTFVHSGEMVAHSARL